MAGGNQIQFGVGFNVNESGLNKLKQSLKEIQQMSAKDLMGAGKFANLTDAENKLKEIKQSASQVQQALSKAFNANLGTTNIAKFNAELQKLNIPQIAQNFNSAGAAGQIAFNNLATSAMTTNVKLKQTYSLLENMKTTLANTVKWNIASGAINGFTRSISSAFNYVKALDSSLTDIRIVTGQSREEMAQFAVQANSAAQALGRQTKEYTNAALAFYQQGLGDAEVQARTEASLKAQNVTGAGQEIVDDLTAVWNGFQVTTENTEKYVDKLAAVADSSASNLSELATAMSKVASTANNMGVDMDQLTAQISTIIATTRQAPQTVGNALKTIYARINDIKAGSDEAEISLGNYTSKMASLGISVLDANGRLRDTGDVMEEIGTKWTSMTREQQIYLAQTMAGQRQMNNLVALFDNWQKYSEMLNVSLNAEGSLNEKNARYMESLSAHLNQFKAATEGLQDTLIDEEMIKGVVDAGTNLINFFNDLLTSMGGVKTLGITLGGVLLAAFSNNLANGVTNFIANIKNAKDNLNQLVNEAAIINQFGQTDSATVSQLQTWAGQANRFQQLGTMSGEERNALNADMQEYTNAENAKLKWQEAKQAAEEYYNAISQAHEDKGGTADANAVEDRAKEQIKFLQDEAKALQNTQKEIEKYIAAAKRANEAWNKSNPNDPSSLRTETKTFDETIANIDKVKLALEGLRDGTTDLGVKDQAERAKAALEELANAEKDPDYDPRDFAEKFYKMYQDIVSGAQDANRQTQEAFRDGSRGIEDHLNTTSNNLKTKIQDMLDTKALQTSIQGIITAFGGFGMAVSGVTAATNAIKTLNDESLTLGQRLGKGIPALASSLGIFTMGLSKMAKGWALASDGIIKFVANAALGKAATEGMAVADMKAAIMKEGLAASIWKVTAAMLSNPITLVIVGLAALAAAIYVCVRAYTALARETEAANKAAAESKARYEEVKDAYDDLKNSLDSYKDAVKTTEELIIGTQEWRDAVQEVNDQVLALMQKYPELVDHIKNVNGQLTISEEGMEKVLELSRQQVDFAQIAANASRVKALGLQSDLAVQNTSRHINFVDTNGYESAAPEGNVKQAVEVLRGIIANTPDKFNDSNFFAQQMAEQFGIVNQPLVQVLYAHRNELVDLNRTLDANNKATEILNETMAHTINSSKGNAAYDNSEYQAGFDAAIASRANQYKAGQDQYYANLAVSDAQKFYKEYAQQMGYEYLGNDNKTGRFTNQQGQQVTIDKEVVQDQLAWAAALKDASSELQNLIGVFNKWTGAMEKDQQGAFAGFMGGKQGSFAGLTVSELRDLWSQITKDGKFTTDAMANFDALGIDYKKLNDAMKQYKLALDHITDGFVDTVKNAYNSLDLKDVSVKGRQQIIQTLNEALEVSGTEGMQKLQTALQNAFSQPGITEELKQKIIDIFASVDEGTSFKDLEAQLTAAGVATDIFGVSLQDLIDILGGGAASFDAIANKYKTAWKEIEDIGYLDELSDEGRAALEAMGIDLMDFFTMGRDGVLRLTGDAEELRRQVDQINMKEMQNGLAEANKKIEELNNLIEAASWEDDSKEKTHFTQREWLNGQANYDEDFYGNRLKSIVEVGGTENINVAQAQEMLGKDVLSPDDIQKINAAMDEVAQKSGILTTNLEKAKQEAQFFEQAMSSALMKLDDDVDKEKFQEIMDTLYQGGGSLLGLSEDLSADLKGNAEASAQVAEAFLRAEVAAERVEKNIDDWADALKDANKGNLKFVETIDELRDTYDDLLNMDGELLSDDFITNTDNLKLMQEAINGNIEAYDQLADAAQQDLLHQGIIDNEDGGMVIPTTIDTSNLESELMDRINAIENSIESIPIGAELQGDGFYAALNDIINAAGMTADQATALLASMGIDADVVEGPPPESQSPASFSYYEPPTYTIDSAGNVGSAILGGQFPFMVPTLASPGSIQTETSSQSNTGPVPFALHVENAKKGVGSGGEVGHKKIGGGAGGGKKGGGGGGSKAKKPKKQKPFKAKIDPYHDVNIKIGDVQEDLEKLGKQRDKLIGKDATDNLREQIELLERQKELLKEKEAIAERELQRHKKELEQMGAVFDGDVLRDGEYERLLEQKKKQVNDAITYFNGLSAEEQEAYQEYLTQLQDEYKELEEALKDYDDTVQLMDDLDLDFQDLINQQIELAIEAFDLEINVKLDLKDAEKDFNEFKKKVIDQIQDDDYAGLAASAADMFKEYYNVGPDGVAGGLINDLRSHSKEILHEIEVITNGGFSQIYGDNLAAATEDLKKYNDELMDALEEAQEVIDETHDHFLDAIDAMQEAFDTQQEGFDKLDDLLSHDMDILQLIHGEENFDEMDRLWEQQIAQDTSRLQALQEQQQYWKDRLDDYEEGTDEWKAAMENWQTAFEATNEAMLQSVENLQSKWENSINSIMSKLRNDTFGGDMDAALEDWDKMTWHEERYLDGIERANGLLELQHNYMDMINNTNDPKIQAKLAELEEKQLDALANKEHLREIDLKLAQQQLTVLQAQMALEDAQQAKTKMRLRRDSQGNYTYQFVADEDDIQQKTQDYMKALSEYRSMANDSLHQDLEDLRDYTQEYYDALQEAQMKYGDDQQALLEEQERLYEMYFGDPDGYINALHNDALSSMTDAQEAMFTNLYGLNQNMEEDLFIKFLGPDSEVTEAARNLLGAGGEIPSLLDAFVNDSAATAFANIDEMTQQTLAGDHGLLPEWSSALWNIADQYDTMFVPRVVEAMNYLQRANQAYVDGLAIMQQAAGRTAADIADGLAYDTAYTNALNDASEALIATQKEQVEASQAVYKALMDNAAAFQNLTGAALDAANANYAYWLSLNGQVATSLPYSYSRASQGTVGQSDYTDAPANGGSNTAQQNSNYNHIASYASGGFTGDWDVSNGKLAVLHEKELVLNEADTKNMLDAVKITRTIFDRVQNMNIALLGNLSAGNALDLAAAAGETILQDVIINADFPGVEDAAQIKQAFNELINLASQKVSKNRRAY